MLSIFDTTKYKLLTDLNDLLAYSQILDEVDRKNYLYEIKQTAMNKLHGN